ncbi:MAG: hypothetical protein IPP29_12390 [Bacteroidetes bacterium]|nr:hypothetical protein [Bacteroidota bacterium]
MLRSSIILTVTIRDDERRTILTANETKNEKTILTTNETKNEEQSSPQTKLRTKNNPLRKRN